MDINRTVRTFGSAYAGSADDVISKITAEAFGVRHIAHRRDPLDQLRIGGPIFARFAREAFPIDGIVSTSPTRVIWSGDGGSVGMGHVYMDERRINLAARPTSDDQIIELFPSLKKRGSRLINRRVAKTLRALALNGARSQLQALNPRWAERRLFLFYLLNNQMRHLYDHFEEIDLTVTEYATPFFDADFLSLITSLSPHMFLYHGLYNRWLKWFRTPVSAIPWQTYPGHIAGPHALPEGVKAQWSAGWHTGSEVRVVAENVFAQLLEIKDPRIAAYFSRSALRALWLLNRVGFQRYNYELWRARNLFFSITGEPPTIH